jgi:hypothetical protein
MSRFETRWLTAEENLSALADRSGQWIDKVHGRHPPRSVALDADSSVSPTRGEQEMSVWNGHYEGACFCPLSVLNQFGDLECCALLPGNVHSADGWEGVPKLVAAICRASIFAPTPASPSRRSMSVPKSRASRTRSSSPPNEARRYCANFACQAGSWTKPRRVVAKVE